ncbi:glycosyltransferase family 4 protein [Pseudomonas sp. Hp2]|uniref:glycosyltransferase family 4 protein n=1 Tax=Pseudomonas sp. Hp2 TaxID=701189 RepID=UPI0015A8C894|nr:glycosyltransferase family 4 protein [Pseudomonas sp. Hp2]
MKDRALRVLLITPDYPPAHGGIQRLLHRITLAMPRAEVRVLTLDHPGAAVFDRSQHQVITRVPVISKRAVLRNVLFNVSAVLRAPDWRPDVILNGHVVSGPAAAWLARRYRAANVLYTYGKEVAGRPGMTAWTMRRSNAGVAVSKFTRGLMVDACSGQLPAPVSVIHPGVEVPPRAGNKSAPRPTVLTTARLRDWYKGHDKIIEALPTVLKAVPDVQWVVIGDGRIKPELEARALQLGLGDTVKFLGAVDDAERDRWLDAAHVFAMPARYPKDEIGGEGFGIVYIEAASWGLPAVASNIGAPCEAVVDGKTGLLVDPENSTEVARALIRLLSDSDFAEALGVQARERVEQEFRWEQVGAQLEIALRSAVGRHKGRQL